MSSALSILDTNLPPGELEDRDILHDIRLIDNGAGMSSSEHAGSNNDFDADCTFYWRAKKLHAETIPLHVRIEWTK